MALQLATLLGALAGPLVKRGAMALGIGTVSYTGASAALSGVLNNSQTLFNSMPPEILALANLTGMGAAIGILFGAVSARLSLMLMKRLGVIAA